VIIVIFWPHVEVCKQSRSVGLDQENSDCASWGEKSNPATLTNKYKRKEEKRKEKFRK
jgi:hypothetical protein